VAPSGQSTYGQILKSTALIGSSSSQSCFGVIQMKAMVLMLGHVRGFDGSVWFDRGAALLAVLCRVIVAGRSALIQGLRKISELAQMNVLGALVGTVVTIPLVPPRHMETFEIGDSVFIRRSGLHPGPLSR
jgi:hypothetical protein